MACQLKILKLFDPTTRLCKDSYFGAKSSFVVKGFGIKFENRGFLTKFLPLTFGIALSNVGTCLLFRACTPQITRQVI